MLAQGRLLDCTFALDSEAADAVLWPGQARRMAMQGVSFKGACAARRGRTAADGARLR